MTSKQSPAEQYECGLHAMNVNNTKKPSIYFVVQK